MKASVDSNILIYAFGLNDQPRYARSLEILDVLSFVDGVVPAQALAEFHRVSTRKYNRSHDEIEAQIEIWSDIFEVAPTTSSTLAMAAALATHHHLQVFDAIIIAASAEAGCRVLFSEDMQHEVVFNGVTIINPFADERHPMLLAALKR